MIASMMLAGIPIADRDVRELALLLRTAGLDQVAETFEDAYDARRAVLALTIPDREASSAPWTIRPTVSPSSAACSCASTSGGCREGLV